MFSSTSSEPIASKLGEPKAFNLSFAIYVTLLPLISVLLKNTSTSGITKFAEKSSEPSRFLNASLLYSLIGIIDPVTITVLDRF